jgi:hypothetical protein
VIGQVDPAPVGRGVANEVNIGVGHAGEIVSGL